MMLHRALFGSLERFMGVLLEQTRGTLPPWLAPEQVRLLPVGEPHSNIARALVDSLAGSGLRAGVDPGPDTLARRVHRAHVDGVPFAVILGDREIAAGSATIRERGGENRTLAQAEVAEILACRCRPPL
jgi:threonyl-tRNA synthetase